MNENLRQKFSTLNDHKIRMTINISKTRTNFDKHIFVQHEVLLIQIVNTLTSIEPILILCDLLKMELPTDVYNMYSNRIDESIHIINKFNL